MRNTLFGITAAALVALGLLAPANAQMSGGLTMDHRGSGYYGDYDQKHGSGYSANCGVIGSNGVNYCDRGGYDKSHGDRDWKYGGYDKSHGGYNQKYGSFNSSYGNGYPRYQ